MRDDEGFTLIELMVVVVILGILVGIGMPAFLGARSRANQRASQASLRNAVTVAKTLYTDNQDYSQAVDTELRALEPSIVFKPTDAPSTAPKEVSVDGGTSPSSTFYAAAKSEDGTCLYIRDVAGAVDSGTMYAKGEGVCDAATAATQTFSPTGWND
jgi:type IV pilus assembly protein PilA